MTDSTFLTDSYYEENEASLKLKPLEKLEKGNVPNKKVEYKKKRQYFEINVQPNEENESNLLDIIYPLLKLGITKAKIYAEFATDEAMKRLIVVKPLITQTLWEKIKTYIPTFQQETEEPQARECITLEDDDYVNIILKHTEDSKEEEDSNSEAESRMAESSFILFNSAALKSINYMRRMNGDKDEDAIPMDLCKQILEDNTKYKNSFNMSDNFIVYGPEATSSSFRMVNCQAAEFELVGNKIILQDIEEAMQASQIDLTTINTESDESQMLSEKLERKQDLSACI